MDERLRQLERYAHEDPVRYYHELRRTGRLQILKDSDPVAWLKTLQKANRCGPTNLAVLGMLGYMPAITIMGGIATKTPDCYYWFKGKWYTEEAVRQTTSPGLYSWRGRDQHTYTKCLHRLSFHIRKVEWMCAVAKTLRNHRRQALGSWLYELENRTILQHHLVDELNG